MLITKDLSYWGDYLETGTYIKVFFPSHNVRYIAINDGVDSIDNAQMDITPSRNIINDVFSLRMEANIIQYSLQICSKSVSLVLSARTQSAVRLSRFYQSDGEAFPGQSFPDYGTIG